MSLKEFLRSLMSKMPELNTNMFINVNMIFFFSLVQCVKVEIHMLDILVYDICIN